MAAHVLPPQTATGELRKKRFTRCDVERMLEAGIFEGQRYELIDGELIDKMGQNPRHVSGIHLSLKWLLSIFPIDRIRIQVDIHLAGPDGELSVPEPDLAVLREFKPEYERRHPRADELLLAVRSEERRGGKDCCRRAALYAREGNTEYWVIDVERRMLHI